MDASGNGTWRIGELGRATGLTVRTLHHYDEIGLLQPAERTESGHRLYGREQVQRLYRILALKQLGMALEDIAGILELEGGDPRPVVRRHLDELTRRIDIQTTLRARLMSILQALESSEEPTTQDFISALEVMKMIDSYYTPEQLAELNERGKQLGPEGMEQAQQQWADLIAAVRAQMEAGADPASPEVQELANQWEELISQFTGGNPEIRESLQKMYETEEPEKASRGMVDPEVMTFAQRAMEARPKGV